MYLWNVSGIVYIGTLIINMIFTYLISNKINKSSVKGLRVNALCYIYFFLISISMLLMFGGTFIYSNSYGLNFVETLPSLIMIYFGYFGPLFFGILINIIVINDYRTGYIWKTGAESPGSDIIKPKRFTKLPLVKKIIAISNLLIISFSLILVLSFFFGSTNLGTGIFSLISGQWALFFAYITLSATFLLLKTLDLLNHRKIKKGIIISGFIFTFIFFLPLISVPSTIQNAEINFSNAFGSDWRTQITSEQESFMLQKPFSLQGYFLGFPQSECIILKDISFYNGTSGVDEGIRLYFDAYLPPNNGIGLPGQNSTLIRIHGGGWMIGDKGTGNMLQMNKYFASQGYCVFDIQYGLYDGPWKMPYITPDYLVGDFDINDMIRHIGIFTKWLIANASLFGADLNSVFISGGSAGGHLTCVTALAIANGSYTSIFGSGITIKGLIPFYPANFCEDGIPTFIDGDPEFLNPELLVDASSPPCLIYQGTQDGLVNPRIARSFLNSYIEVGNTRCAIIWMPFAGHGSDLHFSGYYNMIFLYYMERFLALYR